MITCHDKLHFAVNFCHCFLLDGNSLEVVNLHHPELIKLVIKVDLPTSLTHGNTWIPLDTLTLTVTKS
jgi:hypothetical protein